MNDIAATVDGRAVEGIGLFGALNTLAGGAVSSDAQTALPLRRGGWRRRRDV